MSITSYADPLARSRPGDVPAAELVEASSPVDGLPYVLEVAVHREWDGFFLPTRAEVGVGVRSVECESRRPLEASLGTSGPASHRRAGFSAAEGTVRGAVQTAWASIPSRPRGR